MIPVQRMHLALQAFLILFITMHQNFSSCLKGDITWLSPFDVRYAYLSQPYQRGTNYSLMASDIDWVPKGYFYEGLVRENPLSACFPADP